MNEETSPNRAERIASHPEKSLKIRYYLFLIFTGLLLTACFSSLLLFGTAGHKIPVVAASLLAGLGVPWLGWHLRVPFVARVAAPVLNLSGVALNGLDPRDTLWALADIPVLFFIIGWIVDLCLKSERPLRSLAGRALFTLLWLYLAKQSTAGENGTPLLSVDLIFLLLGIVIVWLPRETLVPDSLRLSPDHGKVVQRGLQLAGRWIMSRVGIGILIVFPSLIFLDAIELPRLLGKQFEGLDGESAGKRGVVDSGEKAVLFWMRESRSFVECDLGTIEVYTASPGAEERLIEAVKRLRRDPRNPERLNELRALSSGRVPSMMKLNIFRGLLPVFYVDPSAASDGRATSGLLLGTDPKWSKWEELRLVRESELKDHRTRVHRATVVILAHGIVMFLLLAGVNSGSSAAWWMAALLAGTNLGWAGESLDFLVERVRYVIWRDYADDQIGATLFSLHTLFLYIVKSALWLTNFLVLQSGLWVALCWPARRGRLVHSTLDAFWIQATKIIVLALSLNLLRYAVFHFSGSSAFWVATWFVLFPVGLILAGIRCRKTLLPTALPVIGVIAVIALALRGWTPLLTAYEMHWAPSVQLGLWAGHTGVFITVVAAILFVLAIERGTFLSPPHVEGQIWLIGVAALPLLETFLGDPVEAMIGSSGLFLGTTVGWIAFAVALWLITPLSGMAGKTLSRWKAKGLGEVESLHETLKSLPALPPGSPVISPVGECLKLLDDLGIVEPQLWKYRGGGLIQRIEKEGDGAPATKRITGELAVRLAAEEGSIRLEEMRMEWRWAAFYEELEDWFVKGGDLLLIPAAHDGALLGLITAQDVPENRFLLRPAVAGALSRTFATAFLLSVEAGCDSESRDTFAGHPTTAAG